MTAALDKITRIGTTNEGSCTASAESYPQKPKPSTTLDCTPESTPVTRNEVCTKPGMLQTQPACAHTSVDQPRFLLPENMRDWLPASDPVWLVISVVARLDTSGLHVKRRTGGAGAPTMTRTCWRRC